MKKVFSGILLALIFALVVGCSGSGGSDSGSGADTNGGGEGTGGDSEQETFHIKMGHVLDSKHSYHLGAEKWKEIIEERSEGRIKVDLFHSSQLGGESQLQDAMVANTVQAALLGSTLGMIDPAFHVNDLPYVYDTVEEAHEKLDGELGTELFSRLDSKGLKGLAWWEQGYRNISTTSVAVNTPEDVNGLKLRVPETSTYVETFEALGANPVVIPFAELYSALEQKVVDGQENPIAQIYTSKLYEVQDYVSLTEHFYGAAPLVMSQKFYDSLPDDLKQIIDEASIEARDYNREQAALQAKEFVKDIEASGTTVIEVDKEAFKEATKSVIENNVDVIGQDIIDLLNK